MKIPFSFGGGGGGDSDECTAVAADILEGKTAIYDGSNDEPAEGTMKDYSGTIQQGDATLDTSNSRVQITVPNTGKYDTAAKLYTSYSNLASLGGLTAAKIATGNTVFGVTGTYTGVGNATADQVLEGRTFSNASNSGLTGTMTNVDAIDPAKSVSWSSSVGLLYARMTNGAHITNASPGWPEVSITQEQITDEVGLTAEKLAYNKSCLGITGTYKPTVAMINSVSYGGTYVDASYNGGEVSYTCQAAGTCYYGGITASAYSSSPDIENKIYLNNTLKDSRDINSDNTYGVRSTMVSQSFSVSAGDVVKVYTYCTTPRYLSVAMIQAVIVTYT